MAVGKLLLFSLAVALTAYYFYDTETITPGMVRGKKVLVTGSSTGIGEQIAYKFSEMGAHVMLTARRAQRLQEVAKRCLQLGASSAQYVVSDMKNLTSAQHVAQEAIDKLGGVDYLVLNHVGGSGSFGYFQGDMKDVLSSITVNYLSYIQLTSTALKALQKSQGSIVIMSSMSENAVKKVGDKITMTASSKEDCAEEVVKAAVLRRPELFYPYWGIKPLVLIRDFAPTLMGNILDKFYVLENIQ
ncbi:hydroxysteroid 11-beta-dehydrogenase 1-like protein A isoform X2 [Rana temporaria]|uniref:hydroxysteroid 11-beta-dehydrogenase 1-like protein A isoform X2 n=1 Tax=Rana temporaria TaxID=8407 RepID=UPI001AAD82A2|nr:hydroxysteroid 11-beta-dehydrogenase 1-like protein A isoform X2 [Rana temporaria]